MEYLKIIGFNLINKDSCVFRYHEYQDAYLCLYVDDIIIAAATILVIKALKEFLRKQYKIKDLGELQFFLGICVVRDRVN